MKKARELLQELDRVDREWGVPKPPETQAEFAERLDKTKKRIMECEQEMLEIIGFDFHTSQPQEWIVKFAKCLAELGRLSPEDAKRLAKRAWLIIPEMSRCTDLMLRFTPERLAMAALLLASRTGIIGADPPMTNDPAMPKDDPIEPRRDTKHQHWLDSLPNLPFSTVFDRNVDFRRKHGRALVFEAAIDAADSIAEYYSKHRGLDVVAVLIREIANTLRVSEFADSRHHPFKKPFWPGWEDERRRAESISGKPASELYIPPSAVESQRY